MTAMLPDPLHPAVVHFPLVLMFILPLVAFGAWWAIHDGARLRTWGWAILTAAALTGSAWVAHETGDDQAEKVEKVVAERLVDQHDDAAHLFAIAATVVLGLALLGLAPAMLGKTARVLTVAGAVVVAGLGVRAGKLGGELVYKHGAASAYAQPAVGGAGEQSTPARGTGGDESGERH
jgi:uncharacterized membrane protein